MTSSGPDVPVLSDNALRFSIVSRPVPHIEYLRTISNLVGASHILAIFEENDAIKVYFDDRRTVDAVMSNVCLHVLGHHVKVDYVVPPGTKVILSSVDPVITDNDILSILSEYGTVVSPIVRPPISDDTELCHIKYGVRYVYMTLSCELPPVLSVMIGDQPFKMRAYIDDRPIMLAIPFIKSDITDIDDVATVVSNEAINENSESNSIIDLSVINGFDNRDSGSIPQISSAISLRGRGRGRGRGRWSRRGRARREMFTRQKKRVTTATSVAAMKIKKNAKHAIRRKYQKIFPASLRSQRSTSLDSTIPNIDFYGHLHLNGESSHSNSNVPFKPVLEMHKLESFLNEAKRLRAPMELAKTYLGDNFSPDSVDLLCQQLILYNSQSSNPSLKQRVGRLIRILKESIIDMKD